MYIDSSAPVQDYRPRYPFQTCLKWVLGAFQMVSSEHSKVDQARSESQCGCTKQLNGYS